MIDTLQQCGSLWQRLRHGVRRLFARSDWARLAGADWAERIGWLRRVLHVERQAA